MTTDYSQWDRSLDLITFTGPDYFHWTWLLSLNLITLTWSHRLGKTLLLVTIFSTVLPTRTTLNSFAQWSKKFYSDALSSWWEHFFSKFNKVIWKFIQAWDFVSSLSPTTVCLSTICLSTICLCTVCLCSAVYAMRIFYYSIFYGGISKGYR